MYISKILIAALFLVVENFEVIKIVNYQRLLKLIVIHPVDDIKRPFSFFANIERWPLSAK